MVTFGEIQKLTQGIIIPKKHLEKDYILNYDDLASNTIFPLYKWNKNPNLVINGIELLKDTNIGINDICVYWQEMTNVYIKSNIEYVKPMGDTIKLSSFAEYILNSNLECGISKYKGEIHPVYHISDVDWARLENGNLIIDENDDDIERYVDISITYRSGRVTKDSTLRITQLANTVSDWKIEKVIVDSIVALSKNAFVSKDGGVVDIIIRKKFNTIYYKEDSNGNIVGEKNDGQYSFEDITNLCTYTCNTNQGVKILGNHVIVNKQEPESAPRSFIITAHYQGFEDTFQIEQERGGIPTYKTELYFLGTKTNSNTCELPTSVRCDGFIPFAYTKKKYIDGKLVANYDVPSYKMKFLNSSNYTDSYNNEWVKVDVEDDADGRKLVHFDVFENNKSYTDIRSCNVIIYGEDNNDSLILTINQPPLQIIDVNYKLKISGKTDYNLTTLPHCHVEFIPYKEYKYEDDSIKEEVILEEGYTIKYNMSSTSTNGIMPYHFIPSDFNGTHSLSFNIDPTNLPEDDYTFTIKGLLFNKENVYICESEPLDITYHPSKLIKTYEFNVNETEYRWKDNWQDSINIPIKSILHETYTEYVEVESTFSDEYKETKIGYDIISEDNLHFNIIKENDHLKISPNSNNNTNTDFCNSITIKQRESEKEIVITLIQEHQIKNEVLVNVKVIATKDNIDEEIWSTSGILYVKDDKENTIYALQLSPCWLYKGIINNEDIIYNGYIILNANTEYTFQSNYFQVKKPVMLKEKDYNFTEKVIFDKSENEVTFYIDL